MNSDSGTTSIQTYDVLIVGAGIAGLTAAQELKRAGLSVLVVEQANVVGGRMATLAIDSGLADIGAQYFTARSSEFRSRVAEWLDQGIVYLWAMGFSAGSLIHVSPQGFPRYAVTGGMARLPQELARELLVHTNTHIVQVSSTGQGWLAKTDSDLTYRCQGLLLTPPVPLALKMLDAGNVELSDNDREFLSQLEYAPSLTGVYRIEGGIRIPAPGAVQRPALPIPWIGDNQQKGISQTRLITVQASGDYSKRMWDSADAEILRSMQASLEPYFAPDSTIVESYLHRWEYASVEDAPTHDHPFWTPEFPAGLLFAGDAFGGARVEGAFLSGLHAGKALAAMLKNP